MELPPIISLGIVITMLVILLCILARQNHDLTLLNRKYIEEADKYRNLWADVKLECLSLAEQLNDLKQSNLNASIKRQDTHKLNLQEKAKKPVKTAQEQLSSIHEFMDLPENKEYLEAETAKLEKQVEDKKAKLRAFIDYKQNESYFIPEEPIVSKRKININKGKNEEN